MDGAQRDPDPDYKGMPPGEMLDALADNAYNWATAYCQFFPEADHGTMTRWFANCIETAHDHRIKLMTEQFPQTRNWRSDEDFLPKG